MNFANLILKAEGWRTGRMQKYIDVNIDILHAPVISLTGAAAKKHLGWRFGGAFYWSVAQTITFNSRAEFGSRPGKDGSKVAMYWNYGMTVNLLSS